MKYYVYTKKAEDRAKELGLEEPRTAGTIAMFAHKPIDGDPTAQAWLAKGYIEMKEDDK